MVDFIPGKIVKHFLVFLAMAIYLPCSFALNRDWDWKITPRVTFSETYSDNIKLARSGREKSAFVTELSPGISIEREGARNKFNLDYQMQNLHNSGGNNNLEIFHQLQTDSHLDISRNLFFLDLNASVNQQNTTTLSSANDNLSGENNRTNVSTYGISPYLTPRFDGYVDGDVRFNYNRLMTGNSRASDTDNYEYSVRFDSGKRYSRVTWFVDYNKRDQIRDNGSDVKFQETLVELRGHFNRYYSVFTQLGHSDNSFVTNTDQNENGFYYAVGARWKPNEQFFLEAAVGNNSYVTVDVMPTRHMHWVTTFRNNDKGTNTGDVWETSFDYRTKRSIWTASYKEDTTTIQSELLDSQVFNFRPQSDISLPTLVDEPILSKKAELSVTYESGRSKVLARLFNTRIIFQDSRTKSDVVGVNGSWDWQFSRRASFYIRPAWQRIQTNQVDSEDSNRYDIALGLSRRIPIAIGRRAKLNANIEYRHINQTSDAAANEFTENRFTVNLFLTY